MTAMKITYVPIADIVIEARTRDLIEPEAQLLAADVRERGLLHPITVWKRPDGQTQLIAGRHRLRAYEINGETKIPVTFMDTADLTPALQSIKARYVELVENMRRTGLNQAQFDGAIAEGQVLAAREILERRRIAAETAKAEATAKLQVAISEDAKAEARKEQNAANMRATEAAAALDRQKSLSVEFAYPKNTHGARDVVARNLGIRPDTVTNSLTRVRNIGLDDMAVLAKAEYRKKDGSVRQYGTQSELGAYTKLKSKAPEKAANFIAKLQAAIDGTKPWPEKRASDLLRELDTDNKREERQDAAAQAGKARAECHTAQKLMEEQITLLEKLPGTRKIIERMKVAAQAAREARDMLDQYKAVETAPVKGNEAMKYPTQTGTAAKEKTRAELTPKVDPKSAIAKYI